MEIDTSDLPKLGEIIDEERRFLTDTDRYFIDPTDSHGRVYGDGWDETKREMVRERDGYECRACGIPNDEALQKYRAELHVHHIIPAKVVEDPDVRNSESNLLSLCPACHVQVERRDEYLPEGVQPPDGFSWVCERVENQYKKDGGEHETEFHGDHVPGWYHVPVEVDGETRSVGVIAETEYLRRQYATEYAILMSSLGETPRRGIIACLVKRGGGTYDDLTEWTTTTKRTVKNHVHALRNENVLQVEDGRPAAISFRNDDLRLLASDVLSFL